MLRRQIKCVHSSFCVLFCLLFLLSIFAFTIWCAWPCSVLLLCTSNALLRFCRQKRRRKGWEKEEKEQELEEEEGMESGR